MKLYNLLLIVFISNLLPCMLYAGTAYYVDPSAGADGNGTYASPWNNIPSINSYSFSTGDDVYFKKNTSCTLRSDNDRLQVDWSGTANDRVIIGCYDGNGDFDCGAVPLVDGNRPIIDGDNNSYPGQWQAAVEIKEEFYVTVQDIKITYAGDKNDAGSKSLKIDASDPGESGNIIIKNMYMWRGHGACVAMARTNTGTISDNFCSESGYPDFTGGGAAIEVTSMGDAGASTNITVARNYVMHGKSEGIGLYKKVTYSTVEHNIVRDMHDFNIYIDAGQHNVIRYNLVYESNERIHTRFNESTPGITIGNEQQRRYEYSGYNEIYGNLLAGLNRGIQIGCHITNEPGLEDAVCHENTYIYNNTLVDNKHNFTYWTGARTAANNIVFKNNISYTLSVGTRHLTYSGGIGITYANNLYDESPCSGGCAADDSAVIGAPLLQKITNWRNLGPDELDGTEFQILTGSPAINAGTDLGGAPYNRDYWGTNRDSNSPWDIGAHEYTDGDTTPPAKPTGLMVVE